MANNLDAGLKAYIIHLLRGGETQRAIERETGCSRITIRRIAKAIGHEFMINGIDIVPDLIMCQNCGALLRRPRSKVIRAKNNFCDKTCKDAYQAGERHPFWKQGKRSKTFSQWAQNQSAYRKFREEVLNRDKRRCVVTGRTKNLHVHHVLPKSEKFSPEYAFQVSNGLTLCEEIHAEIHDLVRKGSGFTEAIQQLMEKYADERLLNLRGLDQLTAK